MQFTINTTKFQELVAKAVKGSSNNKLLPITSLMAIDLAGKRLVLTTTDTTNYFQVSTYVDCKRESYNSPVDDCPFCKAGKAQLAKMFIPVYRVDTQEVQIWERGKKFFTQLEGLCRRLPEGAPMCAQVYEIERNGKPKDTQTTYGIYPIGVPDNTTLEDLPESGDIIGGLVLSKTEDDMNYYLHTGEFPEETETSFTNSAPSRSAGTAESYPRRTPARGDRF